MDEESIPRIDAVQFEHLLLSIFHNSPSHAEMWEGWTSPGSLGRGHLGGLIDADTIRRLVFDRGYRDEHELLAVNSRDLMAILYHVFHAFHRRVLVLEKKLADLMGETR